MDKKDEGTTYTSQQPPPRRSLTGRARRKRNKKGKAAAGKTETGALPPRLHGFKVSHKEIYRRYAAHYELLVTRQDHEGNIERGLRELEGVFTPEADVVELGAGTGRLTRMVAPWVRSILAFDSSEHMLSLARERMPTSSSSPSSSEAMKKPNWEFRVGNNREVSSFGLDPASTDVVLAGWTLSYVKAEVWSSRTWDLEVKRVLSELQALLRPGGSIVILETLGTGNEEPNRRNLMYSLLEEVGFRFRWFRTDYLFADWDEAIGLSRFFFGNKVAAMVEERRAKQRRRRREHEDEDDEKISSPASSKKEEREEDDGEKEEEKGEEGEDEANLKEGKDDGEDEEEEDTEVAMLPECTGLWWIRGEELRLT